MDDDLTYLVMELHLKKPTMNTTTSYGERREKEREGCSRVFFQILPFTKYKFLTFPSFLDFLTRKKKHKQSHKK
jgi:hypothetical protein